MDWTKHYEVRRATHDALPRQDLEVRFQPLRNLRDLALVGFEALTHRSFVRDGLNIRADKFFDAAASEKQDVSIGAWVLNKSLDAWIGWKMVSPNLSLTVNVNVTMAQLQTPHFAEFVLAALERQYKAVPPTALTLELTHVAALENPESLKTIRALRSHGVGISADDVGGNAWPTHQTVEAWKRLTAAGSSDSYPMLTQVKIDRPTVLAAVDDPSEIRYIIDAANHFGDETSIVAEGIGTGQDAVLSHATTWANVGQGFHSRLGVPMTLDAATCHVWEVRQDTPFPPWLAGGRAPAESFAYYYGPAFYGDRGFSSPGTVEPPAAAPGLDR